MAGRTCIFDGCAVGLSRNFNPLAPFSVVLPMSVPSLPSFCQSFTALNSTGLRRRARASDYSRTGLTKNKKARVGSAPSAPEPTQHADAGVYLIAANNHADKSARSVCKNTGYGKHNMRMHLSETKRNQKVRSPVRTSPQMQRITLAVRPLYKENRRPFCVRALEKSGCPFLLPEQSLQLLELSYCLARGW